MEEKSAVEIFQEKFITFKEAEKAERYKKLLTQVDNDEIEVDADEYYPIHTQFRLGDTYTDENQTVFIYCPVAFKEYLITAPEDVVCLIKLDPKYQVLKDFYEQIIEPLREKENLK